MKPAINNMYKNMTFIYKTMYKHRDALGCISISWMGVPMTQGQTNTT